MQVFPKNLLLTKLPPSCDILCLHPMFGPESGKNAWTGLPLVYDRVRVRDASQLCAWRLLTLCASQVGDDPARERRCSNFLRSFEVRRDALRPSDAVLVLTTPGCAGGGLPHG